jgi:hypothetical protein
MAVVDLNIIRRFPYAEGQEFGAVGAFEQIDALMTFAVDPSDEANRYIVDLNLAPRDEQGRVRFTADFSVVKPVDPSRGSNRLLIELPNRGRRRAIDTFNRNSNGDGVATSEPGDGFLFERGMTVASIGWQWDVYASDAMMGLNPPMADLSGEADPGQTVVEIRPNLHETTWLLADRIHRPLKAADVNEENAALYVKDFEDDVDVLMPRSSWKFAKDSKDGVVPSDEHIYLEGGFEPGKCYQVVYSTKEAPVGGAGLLALRDATSFLKYDASELLPEIGDLEHAIGYGVSQTGRMLRHFMYLGLNIDEQGRNVFDGLLPHVAGGRLGAFNHRYAQPSNQSYPSYGHLFPFTDVEQEDPFLNTSDGLLKRLKAKNAVPKIIYTNSSSEYWRGDCSLTHTDPEGKRDVDFDKDARMYHFAGTQHGAGSLPQQKKPGAEGALGLYDTNVVDYSPLQRAVLVNLEQWITEGTAPPPSSHARIDEETAVSQNVVLDRFDELPNLITPDRSKLWRINTIDLGPRASEGIGEYPPEEGNTYTALVTAVDQDGNEVAGIRLPELTQPVATHTGWNMRDPSTGAVDQVVPMQGFSKWFAVTKEQREAANDVRSSIEERYDSRDTYIERVRRDAEKLAHDGYLLWQDIDIVVQNSIDRYDNAVARTVLN